MECTEASGWLSAWLDGELEPAEARRVEEHLAGCERCRRERALLAATSRAVRALPPETVSDGFDVRLRRRLATERTAQRLLRARVPAFTLGAAAVLVLTVFAVSRRSDTPRPPVASIPFAWVARAPELPGFDCRVGSAERCRVDAPCATARSCGAFPVAGLVFAAPGTELPTRSR
jgi:anti-sigma factor RsiW